MRSSESANIAMIRTWLPNVMRSGKTKKAATAISQGSASAGRKRWRRSRKSAARSRAWPRSIRAVVSLAAIETCRLDQKDRNSDRIDEKTAGIGEQIFPGRVEHAQHQCRKQRALQAAQAADRHHDQEQHQVKHRKTRRQPKQLDCKAAPKRCEARSDGEGQRE